jgi:hypothetical protein
MPKELSGCGVKSTSPRLDSDPAQYVKKGDVDDTVKVVLKLQ